jgi:hypothetical protein
MKIYPDRDSAGFLRKFFSRNPPHIAAKNLNGGKLNKSNQAP